MEHKSLNDLRHVADVVPADTLAGDRKAKLLRWAELLEREPDRRLKTLQGIEYVSPAERPLLRADTSPMTVAFEDPAFRAAGLKSDRYGDIKAFFQLSEGQAHRLLCSCHNGGAIRAGAAGRILRDAANYRRERIMLGCAGLVAGLSPLLVLLT